MGLKQSLPIFAEIRSSLGLPVLTDIHEAAQCAEVAQAVDVLQIPAFLCRQTDLLARGGRDRQGRQRQEGAVPGALGHGQCRRQDHRRRQPKCAGDRARRVLRLQHAGLRHARAADPGAHHRRAGDFRRDPFGAAAGREGHRPPAASANSCRCWRVRRSRSASPASSSRPIPIPIMRRPTDRTWCRCASSKRWCGP